MRAQIILASALTVLTACAPGGGFQDPIMGVQKSSLAMVSSFAITTKNYYEKNGERATIAAAEKTIRSELKDPDSALFRNVRLVNYENGKVVCGEVNGKNSYGGYVGYRQFVSSNLGSMTLRTDSDYAAINNAANAGIFAACSGR